jgi:hypothetical protein
MRWILTSPTSWVKDLPNPARAAEFHGFGVGSPAVATRRQDSTMRILPDVLTESDLPLAELHASKLDGLVLPLGDGFRTIDRPDGRAERVTVLQPTLPLRVAVSEESAAWIWGAIAEAPEPLRLAVALRRRSRLHLSSRVVVREVEFGVSDLVHLERGSGLEAGTRSATTLTVTAPLRTAIDLARSAQRRSAAAALHGMVALHLVSPDDVKAALLGHARLTGRSAALDAVERAGSRVIDGGASGESRTPP